MVATQFACLAPHIAALLPPGVVAFETQGCPPRETLFEVERACIQHAVGSRADEFSAGRACARAALMQLGLPPTPIPAGADRAPIWPMGYTGSISHTKGYCVAVAARLHSGTEDQGVVSLGVDVEQATQVHRELWPQVMRPEEIEHLQALDNTDCLVHAALIFSAKEAFYKAQYALTHGWIDFGDVAVELLTDTFVLHVKNATVRIAQRATRFQGRYLLKDALVVTAIAI
jgi:4'-phosphopantetheinyl transferase EntD